MYFCTDCHLPASLDDAVTIFRDGSCICLTCHDRASAAPSAARRTVAALINGLDAA